MFFALQNINLKMAIIKVYIVYVRGTNADTQDVGNWECTCSCKMRESGERRGKRQEYGREHVLRMRTHACTEAQQVRARVRMQPYYRIHYIPPF